MNPLPPPLPCSLSIFRLGLPSLALCVLASPIAITMAQATKERTVTNNPDRMAKIAMLQEWTGPHGGVPPWQVVDPKQFVEAFDVAIALAKEDIDHIAANAEPANFENTFVPLEDSGRVLTRLLSLFGVHSSNLNVGPMPDVQKTVMPMLAAFEDHVTQHEGLFKRLAAVYANRDQLNLTAPQRRLVEERYKSFVRKGAQLDAAAKAELSKINQRLASLFADFSQNVLDEEKELVTWISSKEELDGLPESLIGSFKATAEERGRPDQWAVANTRSAMEPFLTYSTHRGLREKVWRTYVSRGDNGDQRDNNAIITEVLALRAKRAKLLGYPTHAHWRLESSMAKTPEAAMELMTRVWPKAVARVKEEVADMQAIADKEGAGITIEPWDYRFYAEKVRATKYDLDFNLVKPYLQLDKLVDGMMWTASELFELQFKPISGPPVFHPDVRIWEVTDNTGKHVGLFYLDPYAREGKRSGAWMTDYRAQESMTRSITPIVSNNSNFLKGGKGEAVLVSWDDATTLFHEFGHALHGLLSRVQYPSQAGTSVVRDFVEFPSQLCEYWLSTPEVLKKFAVHYQTGEPIPDALIAKIEQTETFNQGFATVEYLASALIDMKLHLAGDTKIDPDRFERDTLTALGMPREIVMRHRTPHFAHIFADDGYSAGYYSYLWADALTADAAEAFEEAGGFFDKAVAKRFRDGILSVGDTMDPAEAFRAFRGRDVDTRALLRKRGFATD